MRSSTSCYRPCLASCAPFETLQCRRSAIHGKRHLYSPPQKSIRSPNVRWSEQEVKTYKYVLQSPLSDDLHAMQGRMKKSLLRRYPRKEEGPLQHSSTHYDLSSTRPPILQLPEPLNKSGSQNTPALQERVKHLYHVARGYFTFYKTGLKAIWSNYKEYRSIAPRAKAFDVLLQTTPMAEIIPKMMAAFERGEITRREYQVFLRT